MILYVNACARQNSRTDLLAKKLLQKLGAYEEVCLEEERPAPMTRERLEYRTKLIDRGEFSNEMFRYARQFAAADEIVIAAPFWDLSFPAVLKDYIENIYVTGIVSQYGEDGRPQGLCRAKKLHYVTTAGGPYDGHYSFEYLRDLAENYFGIGHTELIVAEMLDIAGNDPAKILEECAVSYGL